jgi:hypothetical protein
MKLTDLAHRRAQHLMLFGPSKSGKSTLVSKLALQGFNLVWISLDNGHDVLFKLPPEAQERIEIIVLPDTKNFPVAMDTCRKLISGGQISICHMHGIVNCTACSKHMLESSQYWFKNLPSNTIVVFDHLTQLTDSCMALICKDKPVDYKPKLDDWGSLRFYMTELMSNFQQAPYNLVCIAQVMETEMDDGKKLLTPQVGSREFGKSVGSYFDHIVYSEVHNLSHKAGSKSTFRATVLTGSRGDIAIEEQAPKELSLAPFFSSALAEVSQAQVPRLNGEEAAATVLNFVGEKPVTKESAPPPALIAVPNENAPQAGKSTSMHLSELSQKALAALKKSQAAGAPK